MANLILNGDFEAYFDNWQEAGNNDNEIGSFEGDAPHWTEDTYLQNGNTDNTVAEIEGNSGDTTVLQQTFNIGSGMLNGDGEYLGEVTFDAAMRAGGSPGSPGDGFTVEVLDSLGNVIATQIIQPTTNSLDGYTIPVTFPGEGDYTLRFTEITGAYPGSDDSFGALLDNVEILDCFTRGTFIETEAGQRKIEDLQVGDLVRTLDHGFQPIRWIGETTCLATGNLAPILIRKGALGNTRDLKVSPNHRMMLSGWHAELLFDASEVLVAAKDLINDQTIMRVEGGLVDYYHILFDQHEIVFSEGVASESLYPAENVLDKGEQASRDEVLALFPQLADRAENYGSHARPTLLASEAALLKTSGAY